MPIPMERPAALKLEELDEIENALDKLTLEAAQKMGVTEKDMEYIVESLIDVATKLASTQNELIEVIFHTYGSRLERA